MPPKMNAPLKVAELPKLEGDTPILRLFALLEVLASHDRLHTLQALAAETGLPKATMHRMLQQLEGAGILQRDGDGKQYSAGDRLRRLSENLLLNSTINGARHAVLRQLVDEVGESCNITAFSGGEVLYLDRVETAAPLRFYLHSGSRVPGHCSASGKLFLSQMTTVQRHRLLASGALEKFTHKTIVDRVKLEQEIEQVKHQGYALDDEEFLPGLFCVAVLVPERQGRSNMGIAVQAPVMRLSREKVAQVLPALQKAALALARINTELGQVSHVQDGVA
jgi:IclR family acetate operon transcriptional repressor